MVKTILHDLNKFNAAIDPRNHDYDRIDWITNTETYKEVRCMWLDKDEYDGGHTFIYSKRP
ncbi:MAG: hypothetical protein HDS68_02575 [Bacteroidales bacterium]|nr:hypothetical protein [Bacteroidales bacterium]